MKIHKLYISLCGITIALMILGLFNMNLSAQSNSLTLHDLKAGNNKIFLYDPQTITPIAFDPMPTDEMITRMIFENDNILSTKSRLTIQLFTNEDTIQPNLPLTLKKLKIRVKYLKTNGTLDSMKIVLQTGFDTTANNSYIFYNSQKIDSVVFAYIMVDSIEYDGGLYSPVRFGDALANEPSVEINSITPIKLVAKLDPIHTYKLLGSDIPLNGSSLSACKVNCSYINTTGDINVDWSAAHMPASTTYTELEWTFTNTYPDSLSNPNTPYNFRMNNTSVQISSQEHQYNIPMIFEKGVLIFRIRWVSLRGDDHKPVYGIWSSQEYGMIGDVTCGKFEITSPLIHEGDKKNWQYIATYAEEGKHKVVVTYYDGTMRSRQAVTRLSQLNTVIVGETIYDFQGRPAIQVLPVPVSLMDFPLSESSLPAVRDEETTMSERLGLSGSGDATSTTPSTSTEMVPYAPGQSMPQKIQYYQNFNLNTAVAPYSWMDFDTGALCNTTVHALPMTNSKGASRYYSENNDDRSGFNAYIPNANGYPFIQTEYTPDNTGRISRQGAVGETFQLRRGHDTRYYYGVPSQDELDRFFGSDAGLAAYYKKNMIMDGNGQTAVQYVDMKGKVVASGLSGDCPANLEPLDNKWTFTNTKDLLDADVRLQNELNNTLRSTTRLLIEQNNTMVSFRYNLPAKEFSKEFCAGINFCLDCEYDYDIKVLDECDSIIWNVSQKRVGASKLNKDCDFDTTILKNTSIVLNAGVYSVSRTLTVSPESIEGYGLLYDTTTICPQTKDSLRLAGNFNFPRGGCNLTCENCESETYAGRHPGDTVTKTVNGISMSYIITQRDIDRDSLHCINLCKKTSGNQENILSMMLNDVSKNGMYGEFYYHIPDESATLDINEEHDIILPIAFPLSVFNSVNRLGTNRNWRYPAQNRFNPEGAKYYERDSTGALVVESWVTIPTGREIAYRDPSNSEVYAVPPEKYRMINGRLQVKPEALRDVDFIEAWKEDWAYALLPYHPEYPTLLWYMRNTASNEYDEKLNSIQTYDEAEITISGLVDVNQDSPQILSGDPYFSDEHFSGRSAARTQIKDLLFGTRDDNRRHPLEIKALSSAYCAIENMTSAELTICLGNKRLYNPEMRDAEWQFVRALYLQSKHHIQDSLRSLELVLTGTDPQYSNESSLPIIYRDPSSLHIGDSTRRSSNDYWNKVMRFPTEDDIMKKMIGCPQLERVVGSSHFMVPDIDCMREKAEAMLGKECNKCPVAQELETLLWLLASTNKLTTNATEGMIGRIINTSEMITSLGSPDVRRMSWSSVISGNELLINIQAQNGFSGPGATYTQFIKLKSFDTDIQWDNLRVIRCLNYTASPKLFSTERGRNFTLRGIDDSGREFKMEGVTSCFVLDSCKYFQPVPSSIDVKNNANTVGIHNGNHTPSDTNNENATCCPPLPPPMPAPVNDCERNRQNLIAFFYKQNLQEKVEQQRIDLRKEYTDACLQNADSFKAVLDNSIYQITLYYYDQAGNLVKTVPPAGVDTLPRDRIRTVQSNRNVNRDVIISPEHRLASTYKYNTLNQVIEKISPDAGMVQLFYDSLGRVHLSQDALQATLTNSGGTKAYSYILFDDLGRISESGQAYLDPARVNSGSGSHFAVRNMVNRARKEEVVHMYYDKPINSTTNRYFSDGGQQLLRNRVASTVFTETVDNDHSTTITGSGSSSNYNNATHYSYDYHGNVKTLIQENRDPVLIDKGHSRKRIDYDYDLISGKTNRVCYQCDSTDQFVHQYEYDADNRITNIYTGTLSDHLQQDAKYIYYKHGPVARIELGDRLVQGIDYAYTLQGWLKGINSNTALPENDMGFDGQKDSRYARDRYGFSLNYFTNDYTPIAPQDAPHSFLASSGPALSRHLARKSLYDGNIASSATTIKDITGPRSSDALLNLFTYDQLQRVKTSNSLASLDEAGNSWGAGSNSYSTSYSYDPNGNIINLTRSAGTTQFDNLTYTYPLADNRLQNNKLKAVSDQVSGSLQDADDIVGNIKYTYDQNGNIIRENSAILRWTASGRIKQYGEYQHYAYDAAQHRVKKTDGDVAQFYVYDPTGNILALYTYKDHHLYWTGSPIYGASRLGMYHANKQLQSTLPAIMDTLWRGKTEYELTNHLGDVLATITDKKLTRTEGSSTYSSDLISAQEYLPFGMQMPNRHSSEVASGARNNYPFAYNGMEQDKKDGADGYTTEFRQYDSRIGRWKSMDPKTEKTNSYYDGLGNNPIALKDIQGDDPPAGSTADSEDELDASRARTEADETAHVQFEMTQRLERTAGFMRTYLTDIHSLRQRNTGPAQDRLLNNLEMDINNVMVIVDAALRLGNQILTNASERTEHNFIRFREESNAIDLGYSQIYFSARFAYYRSESEEARRRREAESSARTSLSPAASTQLPIQAQASTPSPPPSLTQAQANDIIRRESERVFLTYYREYPHTPEVFIDQGINARRFQRGQIGAMTYASVTLANLLYSLIPGIPSRSVIAQLRMR